MTGRIIQGDAREQLAQLPAGSVQCCVTSPPFWQLRSYLPDSDPLKAYELGSEPTPAAFVANLVDVMRGVKRVLREDGTCWLNMGDSYSAGGGYWPDAPSNQAGSMQSRRGGTTNKGRITAEGIPPKNLCLIPERLALALQDAGWIVRSVITWVKLSSMPESVRDRPSNATERIFLLAKSPTYYYDQDAVREPHKPESLSRYEYGLNSRSPADGFVSAGANNPRSIAHTKRMGDNINPNGANLRNAWILSPEPTKIAHFATFPSEIPRRAILAGTSEHGACGCCGAPWRRVVERTGTVDHGGLRKRADAPGAVLSASSAFRTGQTPIMSTTGWAPTCRHTDAPVVPCVILDPFAGSGTSLMVAEQLGRSWVGIELAEKNIKLIEQRTAQRGFASVPIAPRAPRAGGMRGEG